MKKIILFLCLLFVFGLSKAQVYQLMPQYGYDVKRMKFDSTLSIPTTCGVPTIKSNVIKNGAIAFDSCNKRFYAYDPKDQTWAQVSGGSSIDSTIVQTKYRSDTARTNIYTSLNTKLNKADTIFMEQRKVPYTGATTDVDLGANGLNAKNIKVTGTAGAGHIDLKHQSANASAQGNSSVIFADVNGNLAWDNATNPLFVLRNNHFTANREFRLPDSTGTFALLQNVNNRFVDSIYRKTGKDSIFYRIGSTELKIKDSVQSDNFNSPDRINGFTDNKVTANMKYHDLQIDSVSLFKITGFENTTLLNIQSEGAMQMGDVDGNNGKISINPSTIDLQSENGITWYEPILQLNSQVKTTYVKDDVGLNSADYNAPLAGLYIIVDQGTYTFYLPDAIKWKGQSVQIVNNSGDAAAIDVIAGTWYGASSLDDQKMIVAYSDGANWHGFMLSRN